MFHNTTAAPLRAVAAAAALDSVEESVAAVGPGQAFFAVLLIVILQVILFLHVELTIGRIGFLILTLNVLCRLFLAFLQEASSDTVAAAVAVDAVEKAVAATHVLLANTTTAPLRAVAAAAALDSVEESIAAVGPGQAFFAVLLIVILQVILFLHVELTIGRIGFLILTLNVFCRLFFAFLQKAPTDTVAAAVAVDAVEKAVAATHVLSTNTATAPPPSATSITTAAPPCAIAASIAPDSTPESPAAVGPAQAMSFVFRILILQVILFLHVELTIGRIGFLIPTLNVFCRLFLTFLQEAPSDTAAAAVAVDAVEKAVAATHVLLANTTTTPLRAVAAAAALDSVEESVAAVGPGQAFFAVLLIVILFLHDELTIGRIGFLILTLNVLCRLFLAFLQEAPSDTVAAAVAVDAVEKAVAATHVLLANTTTAPLRAVAAAAALDSVEESIAAVGPGQAFFAVLLIVILQVILFLHVELTIGRIGFLILTLNVFCRLFLAFLQEAPSDTVAAAVAVDAVEKAVAATHVLLANTTTAPLRAVAAAAALDSVEESVAAVGPGQALFAVLLIVILQVILFLHVELTIGRIGFLILTLNVLFRLFLAFLQEAPSDTVAAAVAVDAVEKAVAATHVLLANTTTAPLRAVAAAAALDSVEESIAAVGPGQAFFAVLLIVILQVILFLHVELTIGRIGFLILTLNVLFRLFLAFLQEAPSDTVAAAVAVDAVEKAVAATHVLLANTTTAPLRAVAAAAALDSVEESVAAVGPGQAFFAVLFVL